jgi:hypothetical protein
MDGPEQGGLHALVARAARFPGHVVDHVGTGERVVRELADQLVSELVGRHAEVDDPGIRGSGRDGLAARARVPRRGLGVEHDVGGPALDRVLAARARLVLPGAAVLRRNRARSFRELA